MDFRTRPRLRQSIFAMAIACAAAVPIAAQQAQKKSRAPKQPAMITVREVLPDSPQPGRRTPGSQDQETFGSRARAGAQRPQADGTPREPREHRLRRAASFDGDLR